MDRDSIICLALALILLGLCVAQAGEFEMAVLKRTLEIIQVAPVGYPNWGNRVTDGPGYAIKRGSDDDYVPGTVVQYPYGVYTNLVHTNDLSVVVTNKVLIRYSRYFCNWKKNDTIKPIQIDTTSFSTNRPDVLADLAASADLSP